MNLNRYLFHLRVASLEEFFVAFAESVERWSTVNDRLALASASAAAERIPMAFLAFLVAVCRNANEFLCHLTRDQVGKGIVIDVSELPFVENVKVAGEYTSVAFNYGIAGTDTRHRAVLGRSAEKHSDVIVKITNARRLARREILVIFVERNLQKFGVTLGSERKHLLFAVKGVKAGNELYESVFLQ